MAQKNVQIRNDKDTRKKESMLSAVETLILRGQKYSEIKVSDITAEAGTSRSTFYLHFGDKRELIVKLIDRYRDGLLEASQLPLDGKVIPSRDMIRLSMINLARYFRKHVAFFQAIAEVAATDHEIGSRYRSMIISTTFDRENEYNTRRNAGTIREGVTEEMSQAITWMVERAYTQTITAHTDASITKDKSAMAMIDALVEIQWRALYEGL